MKRNKLHLLRNMAAAALLCAGLASCSQDDLPGQGDSLPEGKYPLEISSITMSVESSEEPWGASHAPQTRVSENTDGSSSKWDGGEKIYVQVGNGTLGTYVLNTDGTIDAGQSQPAYWGSNANEQVVKAWHTSTNHTSGDGTTVTLSNQSGGLAYILKNSEPSTANFGQSINLKFSHTLAKVRVVLQGDKSTGVNDVKIKSFTSCTHTNGADIKGSGVQGWITMNKIDKGGGTKYWEANVVPNATITELQVNTNGSTKNVTLYGKGITPIAAKINIITLTAGEMTYNLNDYTSGGTINVTGKATITGSPKSPYLQINLKDGADVTLQNVDMKRHYSPITCEGNVTITLSGTNIITGGNGTLSVSGENSTLTIKEVSPSGGSLELKTSDNYSPSALSLNNGANLIIESGNITADASTSEQGGNGAAGIGSPDNESCGDITINGGTIIAKGGIGGPGIGAGGGGTCGIIKIMGGKIEAIGGHGYYGYSTDACGAGIGAGTNASYKEIKISGDATVKATGGCWEYDPNRWAYDIGPGYNSSSSCGTVTIENPANVTATKGRIYGQ